MEYPKIKPELDRRQKLLPEEREEIRGKYKQGVGIGELRRQYRVGYHAIRATVDDKYRKDRSSSSNARNKIRRATEPEWVKRHRELTNASHRYKREIMAKEEKAYDKEQLKGWKKRNPERWKELMIKHREKKKLINKK